MLFLHKEKKGNLLHHLLKPVGNGRVGQRHLGVGRRREGVHLAVRHIAVAVPAGFSGIALDVHVSDAPRIDQFGVEGGVTPHAVFHDDLSALVDGADGLSLLARDKLVNVVHAVFAFEEILPKDIVVRHVAVVARGVAGVRPMHPRGVVGAHDVAVDTGRGVISQVGVKPEQIEEKSA